MGFGLGLLAGGFLLDQKSASFLLSSTSFAFLALIVPAAFLHKTSRVRLDLLEYLSEFRKPGVLLFCASYSLFALHWGAEGSSYGLFLRDYFHLTKLQSGIFMGLPILGLGISAMFTGHSLDRRRGSLQSLTITAFLCSGLGQVLMVVPNIYLSFVLRIVHEIGDGMAGAILLTEMARRFRIDCIGGQSSLVTLSTILAQSLGLFIFSQTGQHWGHDWSMIAGGLAAAAPVMILLIAGRDAPAPAGAGERAGE
jgi:MFS family permease